MTAETTEAPISVREFARRVGISWRLAYELIDAGEISYLQYPSRPGSTGKRRLIRIEPAEAGRFLDRAREAGKRT